MENRVILERDEGKYVFVTNVVKFDLSGVGFNLYPQLGKNKRRLGKVGLVMSH